MKIAFPHPPGVGGPGSFQLRFEKQITKRGWRIAFASSDNSVPECVFVIAGTKRIFWLFKLKRKGIPIIYRLDGINWLHKRKKIGIKHYLLAEYRNWNNKLIHAFFADYIVYQSEFVKQWWDRAGWKCSKKYSIIQNGVDLDVFKPRMKFQDEIPLVCLEGTIDYSPYAIELLNLLAERLPVEMQIKIYGRFERADNKNRLNARIKYFGPVPSEQVPEILSKCIYLSLDVNPACPNTVIEALACGSPVVAFDTGALRELVDTSCGEVVPYGADPWCLEMPDANALIKAIIKIHRSYVSYSIAARRHAIRYYDMELVFKKYLDVIQSLKATT